MDKNRRGPGHPTDTALETIGRRKLDEFSMEIGQTRYHVATGLTGKERTELTGMRHNGY